MLGAAQLFAFSSYTKGRYKVTSIQQLEDNYIIEIAFPVNFKEKLLKKKKHFGCELYLEIDGIPALIIEQNEISEQLFIQSKIAVKLFESTTIKNLKIGDKVSIGLQSLNEAKYLIENQPVGRAKFVGLQIAPGHNYIQELTFQTSLNLADLIAKSKWIALNGSGFCIQSHNFMDDKIEFKIHVGRATRELSIFGTSEMEIGQEFNLSPAFTEESLKKSNKLHM